jgi:enoyl-CoA hydratase/carnithine racemase
MSEPTLVHLDRGDDGVAVVRLDHPKVNALSTALLAQLHAIATQLTDDPPGAVVVTGGERLFAAGADISEFGGPDEARTVGGAFRDALDAVAAIPRATVASVSGFALGGGCELALACDFRIASERAVFGQPEILLGIIPGGGGTQRLARLVGPARAKDLIFTGRQVKASEALAIGLVDEVVAPDQLEARTRERAAALARGAVVAQGSCQDGHRSGPRHHAWPKASASNSSCFVEVFRTQDAATGVASFLEQGPGNATFEGR